MTGSERLALARRMFGWFAAGDMEAFTGALHPHVCARPSSGRQLEGRGEVIGWLSDTMRQGADVEARPLDYEIAGNCILVRGYLRQRTGRILSESQMFWLCEIEGGQVLRMESHPSRTVALASC